MDQVSADQLLGVARLGDANALGRLLQLYRNYLIAVAAMQLDRRVKARVSPSDLAQETMLAAYRDFGQFRGQTEREFLAWLRQILVNCLHRVIETNLRARKRDVRCEVSLQQRGRSGSQSGLQLGNILADPGSSPSARAGRHEEEAALADQLARLKPEYRQVIMLRTLKGFSFDEIAEQMGRKPGTVRMLWLRAMARLKDMNQATDES